MSRDFAPEGERAASLRGRLAAIPELLSAARRALADMSALHVETALAQLEGTRRLVDVDARRLVDAPVVDEAVEAVAAFSGWLAERLPESTRSPRLGPLVYGGALWHAMDDDTSAEVLLSDARAHLDLLGEQLAHAAREYLGPEAPASDGEAIRAALETVARQAVVTDATLLPSMERALERTTEFVKERGLVTVPDVEVRLIDMPEIHRGVAVAYCDAPGPLESGAVATYVAVAPTPTDWDEERIDSFYREYNGVQLHNLTVHEAMPGHVLQLAHAQRLESPTRVRRFGRSGVFVEGWAVYSEELMVERGYAPADDDRAGLALRLQQLKMQARVVINAILDVCVHADDMSESEALALMMGRGYQEEGEAVGKWRRALLTSAQLPTYYAGYRAVSGIVGDLRVLHPHWSDRDLHDLVLSHGSPAPRHLRTLLGI